MSYGQVKNPSPHNIYRKKKKFNNIGDQERSYFLMLTEDTQSMRCWKDLSE